MENSQPPIPSISLILKKISDDKTLTLFNSIAVADGNKYIPLKEMNLTTKQYYTRISGLLDAGLIKRHKGKYSLTIIRKGSLSITNDNRQNAHLSLETQGNRIN
jgi:hypothetical protein